MTKRKFSQLRYLLTAFLAGAAAAGSLSAQETGFTYQGRLWQSGAPAEGVYDLRFRIFGSSNAVASLFNAVTSAPVAIHDGLFTVTLDFGSRPFETLTAPHLEIAVRTNGSSEAYEVLAPRQAITLAPSSIRALSAASAGTAATAGTASNLTTTATISASNVGSNQVVKALNGLRDQVTLGVGTNLTLTTNGQTLQIGLVASNVVAPSGVMSVVLANDGAGSGLNADFLDGRDSSYFAQASDLSDKVQKSGDTMTGDLTLQNFTRLNFGPTMRQMVNLFSESFGLGVQTDTFYQRSDGGFAWFRDGGHNNSANNPGTGGSVLMTLNSSGHLGLNTNNPALAALVVNDQVNLNTAIFGNRHPISLSQAWPIIGFNSYYSGSGGVNNIYTGGGGTIPNYAGQIGLDPGSGTLYFSTTTGSANSHAAVTSTARMTIANNGNVGIGTSSPGGKLDINTGNGNLQVISDLVPGLNVTGGSIPGVMRFRNALEVWPSLDQSRAGYIDVRDTNNATSIVLRGNGTATVKILEITGGADIAEPFQISDEAEVPAGSVVVIDDERPGRLRLSDRAYDTRVAGIVSGANGVKPGLALHQKGTLEGGQNVALTGRVYALADASQGAIKPGDLLTTSDRPGHVMAARDFSRIHGAVLGKAMSRLEEGQGLVLVLVTLQ